MVKYEVLLLTNSIFLCLARFFTGIVFFYNDDFKEANISFLLSFIYFMFIICVFVGNRFYKNFNKDDYLYKKYKRLLAKKRHLSARAFKRFVRMEFIKIRHLAWYIFQLEVVFTTIYFSLNIGWGYGFDLFLVLLVSFFYLNFRKYHPLVFVIPIVYFVLYIALYFFSTKTNHLDKQVIIYIINAIFAMSAIFYSQVIMELGQVIRLVNDENRKSHLKNLASFDTLTNTYHKYSFLEIINAKLEHNADEDIITQASVLIIEINNLKKINEEYSTELGNEVLKEFAYILRKHSENYEKYIARWSGNEFLVFIINEDKAVVKNYIDEVKQEALKNRFGIRGASVLLAYGLSHTISFDYNINNFIQEAYEKLLEYREKSIY